MDDLDENTVEYFVTSKKNTDTEYQLKLSVNRQICAAVIVNLLSICNGFSAGWTSPITAILQNPDNPLGKDPIAHDTLTWISSVLYIGGLCGVPIWNDFADRFGRKINGYFLALTQIISWLGIIFARDVTFVIASRILMGIGGSGIMIQNQLFINETVPDGKLKNALSCFVIAFMNFGLLLVNTGGYFLSYENNNCLCLSIPVFFIVTFYWLPETPFYLMSKGKISEAQKCLLWYRGGMENATSAELTELYESIQHIKSKNVPYTELLKTKENLRATVIVVILFIGQQLSGYSAVLAYTFFLFDSARMPIPSVVSTIIVLFILFLVSCLNGFVINLFQKKYLLFTSFLTAFFSFLSFYSFFIMKNHFKIELTYIPILSLMIFLIWYNIGIGPVPFSLSLDMFPVYVLNNGLTVATIVGVFTAFVTVKMIPPPKDAGQVTLVLACLNLIMAIFVFFCVEDPKDTSKTVVNKITETYSIN